MRPNQFKTINQLRKENAELRATIEVMSNKDIMNGILADKNEKIEQMEILDQSRREEIRMLSARIEKAIGVINVCQKILYIDSIDIIKKALEGEKP
jgi:hypothetical protein